MTVQQWPPAVLRLVLLALLQCCPGLVEGWKYTSVQLVRDPSDPLIQEQVLAHSAT